MHLLDAHIHVVLQQCYCSDIWIGQKCKKMNKDCFWAENVGWKLSRLFDWRTRFISNLNFSSLYQLKRSEKRQPWLHDVTSLATFLGEMNEENTYSIKQSICSLWWEASTNQLKLSAIKLKKAMQYVYAETSSVVTENVEHVDLHDFFLTVSEQLSNRSFKIDLSPK